MVNSWRSAEIIDNARHHNAYDPKEKIEIDEPRFKSRLHGNDVRFQQRKHSNEENAGEHVRNQFCHTLKIIQSNTIDVNRLKKDIVKQDITGFFTATPFRMTKTQIKKQTGSPTLRFEDDGDATTNAPHTTTYNPPSTVYFSLLTVYRLLPTAY